MNTISPELSRDLDKLVAMRDEDFAQLDQEEALAQQRKIDDLRVAADDLRKVAHEREREMTAAIEKRNLMNEFPRGLRATIVRGRKFPIGTVGTIYNVGESQYGSWVQFDRDDTGERVFVDRKNIVICDEELAYAEGQVSYATQRTEDAMNAANRAHEAWKRAVIEAAGIDLGVQMDVTREQAAYRDYDRFTTPCNPAASDDLIKRALGLLDPQGSCWGALRWSCGTTLLERLAPDLIRVERSTGIAD